MKATGEVMAIGSSFEQAMMKAVRSIELGLDTLHPAQAATTQTDDEIAGTAARAATTSGFSSCYEALKRGISTWTRSMQHHQDRQVVPGQAVKPGPAWSRAGEGAADTGALSRRQEARLPGQAPSSAFPVSELRPYHRKAAYKMVDTCAAEFQAQTPYFYSTFDEENEAADVHWSATKPARRRSWYSVPAPSGSARASSSTTARYTVSGR